MNAMRGWSRAVRGVAVVGVVLAPFAAIDAEAAVNTSPAQAEGPGLKFENSGGNVEFGKGHQESKVTKGDPKAAPAAPGVGTLAKPAVPVDPAAAKTARARALVDAARANAQAQVDAARQQVEEAVEQAHDQAEAARNQSDAQTDAAQARSSAYSADD
jgi:hypothetical protein